MRLHEMDAYPPEFLATLNGEKTHQISPDSSWELGDYIKLHEFAPCVECKGHGRVFDGYMEWDDCPACERKMGQRTGRQVLLVVTYITGPKELWREGNLYLTNGIKTTILSTRRFSGNLPI